MVECAVGRGDMTVDFLRQRLPGRRNGKGRRVLDWVVRGAESLLETLARRASARLASGWKPRSISAASDLWICSWTVGSS
jgi:hypothetical protein